MSFTTKDNNRGPSSQESADRRATRQLIVRQAHQQFMENGFRSVSTRKIADACGLTQPALYHYFADKESLYVEVLRAAIRRTQGALERIGKRKGSIRVRLHEAVAYLTLRMPEDLHQMHRDIERELSEESRRMIREWWTEGYVNPLADILREARFASSGGAGLAPDQAAFMLLGMINPAAGKRSEPSGTDAYRRWRKEAVDRAGQLVDVLLFGILAEEERARLLTDCT